MKRAQLAINSVSTIRADLAESLAAYHEAGFRNVEFPLRHVRDYLDRGHTMADVSGLLTQYEMRCIGGFDCAVECFSPVAQRSVNHARILDGKFSSVQQAIGTKPDRPAAAAFLRDFVEEAKASGLVQRLIEKHGVDGRLTVAPLAE